MDPALLSLRALFTSVGTIHLATAALSTLVALRIAETGGGAAAVSAIAAAYSAGFLLGCFFVFRPMAEIGHVRAFAAAAALCALCTLMLSASDAIPVMVAARFATGLATAGLYAIGDAWINDTADASSRGRTLSIYYIVLGITSVLSQAFLIVFPGDLGEAFVAMSALYSLAILVLAPTRTAPPPFAGKARLRVMDCLRESPTAVVGTFVNGFIVALSLNIGPFRLSEAGVSAERTALIFSVFYLGRILFQFPLGRASDRSDRRVVIAAVSFVAAALFALLALAIGGAHFDLSDAASGTTLAILLVAALTLGGTVMSLYSLLVAHALDRTVPVYVGASAVTHLFIYTLGSVIGPIAGSALSALYGPGVTIWLSAGLMAVAGLFAALRITGRERVPPAEAAEGIVVAPTSVSMTPDAKR